MLNDFVLLRAGDAIPFADVPELSEPEKMLASYFDSSSLGFCIVDSDLRYLTINDKLAQMNGLPAEEHIGKTVREVVGDFADQLEPVLRKILTIGEPVLDFEIAAPLPAKTEIRHWVDYCLPIKDSAGTVRHIASIVIEVTQKKRIEATLNHMDKRAKNQADRLQMVLDIGNILSSNWDVPQVFPQISARIRRVLRQEYAGLSLHDANTGLLVRQSEDFPLGRGLTSHIQVLTSDSPSGRSLEQGSPVIFSEEQMQGSQSEIAHRYLDEGLQSLCCVPMLRPKGPLGVLVLGSTRKNAFHADDLGLLNQVAIQLGVALENNRAAAEIDALKRRLNEERGYLQGEIRSQGQFAEIIGESPILKQVLDQVTTVAASEATVLILGETGTGKELIAHAIHRMSRRKNAPFIKLNCAAIPTGLLESELFGHEKGAFTGAVVQKIGRLELADGGTLFLDEIGEISLELQPKLLRVLQDQEFERLGSTRTIRVHIRLIAATNRDLARSVADHQFRNDLFYRLNVFPIRMPALREHPEDIALLVRFFVRRFARRMDRHIERIPKETMAALKAWYWPGNVRELENLMERSVILSPGRTLHVPLSEMSSPALSAVIPFDDTLNTAEREHIIRVLRESGGLISGPNGAARRLGLKRTTLQSKMQRLRITRQDYSNPKHDEK
jgi:formate hydrogenlyase transcriptional activator